MKYKIDLHTHSLLSFDGGLTKTDYTKILQRGILDVIAVTDHNDIAFAKTLNKEIGNTIIIGEEIQSLDGEIIGLFLKEKILPHLSAKETMQQIHAQKGVVYIPHPFEKQRSSIQLDLFLQLVEEIDICEVFNAREFGRKKTFTDFVSLPNMHFASSSDAHCRFGIGSSYSYISQIPNNLTITSLLKNAEYRKEYAPLISYFCPAYNKIRRKIFAL